MTSNNYKRPNPTPPPGEFNYKRRKLEETVECELVPITDDAELSKLLPAAKNKKALEQVAPPPIRKPQPDISVLNVIKPQDYFDPKVRE